VEKIDQLREYVENLCSQLHRGEVSLLDFDQMRARLEDVTKALHVYEERVDDADMLSRDYRDRISGMIKAMAAVSRNSDSWQTALDETEQLGTLTGESLIRCYRKTAARFRDCFPASFGLLPASARLSASAREMTAFK
jgi:hypothetical protein